MAFFFLRLHLNDPFTFKILWNVLKSLWWHCNGKLWLLDRALIFSIGPLEGRDRQCPEKCIKVVVIAGESVRRNAVCKRVKINIFQQIWQTASSIQYSSELTRLRWNRLLSIKTTSDRNNLPSNWFANKQRSIECQTTRPLYHTIIQLGPNLEAWFYMGIREPNRKSIEASCSKGCCTLRMKN